MKFSEYDDYSLPERDYAEVAAALKNERLLLAEILYRLPDYPEILQSFIWQERDLAPQYPRLNKFLSFWENNIDGKIFKVRVAFQSTLSPGELTYAKGQWLLH